MKICATGGNGRLGRELAKLGVQPLGRDRCPMNDPARIAGSTAEFDTVIHCASVLSIEAEEDHKKAWKVNVRGTEYVAEVCAELGKRLVYISSDYVFEGFHVTPYREQDIPLADAEGARLPDADEAIAQGEDRQPGWRGPGELYRTFAPGLS